MKKIYLVLLCAVALSAFSFVSFETEDKDQEDVIVLKGSEKSGYNESNLESL